MRKKEEILENFKTAIKSTIKSLSNKDNLEISFGGQDVASDNNKLRLPEINEIQNKINFLDYLLPQIPLDLVIRQVFIMVRSKLTKDRWIDGT